MPNHILLIGAGFSANWGAPLASEITGSLLSDLHDDPALENALRTRPFEEAFADFQGQPTNAEQRLRVERFGVAVVSLFDRINETFSPARFEWQDNGNLIANLSVKQFLARFDAIFSLNQDLLLETCYEPYLPMGGRWDSVMIPGMTSHFPPTVDSRLPRYRIWTPDDSVRISARTQPLYKLHGSSNWQDGSGNPVLIIGGGKAGLISRIPILKEYHAQFEARLNRHDTKLMVIGYSFQDEHINSAIEGAYRQHKLGVHLVDPRGAEALRDPAYSGAAIRPRRDIERIKIIGETRQPLSSFMGRDTFPYRELMRFFR